MLFIVLYTKEMLSHRYTHSLTRTRIQYIYNREKSTLIGEKSEQKKLEITFHVLCVARFDEKEAQWSSVFAHTHIQTKN